jgi:hypothetical protein
MGYTIGRRHTEESLQLIASLYSTRSEFQTSDSGAYVTARKKGKNFLDKICSHMISGSYSTPQLICKHILEKLLGVSCMYNTKDIISPYELDLYFSGYSLAIEYNGKLWHSKPSTISRDATKKEMCKTAGITLITITENTRAYENDVKEQLINNLNIINTCTNNSFIPQDIHDIECKNVYDYVLDFQNVDRIKDYISTCKNIAEFQKKYSKEYHILRRSNKLFLLDSIREVITYTDEQLLNAAKKITSYTDFVNDKTLYQKCYRRNLLPKATKHMTRFKRKFIHMTDDELLQMAKEYTMKSTLAKSNPSLLYEILERGISNKIVYKEFVYIPSNTLRKINNLEKCYEDAKKYNNYIDFKNDTELFNMCKRYQIIEKIVKTFPPINHENNILEESKKYNSFEEFKFTELYIKSKQYKGLTDEIKKQNNWRKSKMDYIKEFPEIVSLLKSNETILNIMKIANIGNTTIWRVKKAMGLIHKK